MSFARREDKCDMAKKSRWQVVYRYICRSSKNPESLARGVGLGLFIGFLPAIGFQVIIAFLTAGFFNANRIVTMLGTLVTNPFTAIPVSAFSIWLGDWVLPGTKLSEISLKSLDFSTVLHSSSQLGLAYVVGCLMLSCVSSSLGYGIARLYLAKARRGLPQISRIN